MTNLPTIDLSHANVNRGSISWKSTCENVREAMEEYGCFIAIYDKISLDLHNKVFRVIEPMFELRTEVKERNKSNLPYHAYFKTGPVLPLLESFGIEDANILDNTRSYTHLLWPNGNDPFCETMHEFAKKISELEKIVTTMIFESYGARKYLESHLNSSASLLRIAKYRAPEENEVTFGTTAHTDKNCLTVIHQNDIDGLEIQTKDGVWKSYEPRLSNSFMVMAGESFLAWSNERIHAPVHRVVMKGTEKARYSVMLFSRSKELMETPKELVDEEHPLMFKPFDYLGLINFYFQDNPPYSSSTIKAYCGL